MKTLVFLMLIFTANASFANETIQIGTDRDGNDISVMSPVKEIVSGIYNLVIKYDYRLKHQATNAIPPINGMRGYKVYIDHAEHSIIVDCNGLQRVTVLDSRLYNNIGKEIELYKPDFKTINKFRLVGEKIITNYFCK